MKRIDFNDMDAVMSFKGKGNSRRYAFNDFSERIKVENKTAKILKDRIKQIKNQKVMHSKVKGYDQLEKLGKSLRKVQLERKESVESPYRGRCNMTHIEENLFPNLRGNEVTNIEGTLSISQVKEQYPDVLAVYWSKDMEEFTDAYHAANNVN